MRVGMVEERRLGVDQGSVRTPPDLIALRRPACFGVYVNLLSYCVLNLYHILWLIFGDELFDSVSANCLSSSRFFAHGLVQKWTSSR